jgi:hypothetical protein
LALAESAARILKAARNGSLFSTELAEAFSQCYFGIGGNDSDAIGKYKASGLIGGGAVAP